MNHRETIQRREPRPTQKQRGVLGSIRPRIHACPPGYYGPGDRVKLKIEDCSPAGLKMFCYRDQVIPLVGDAEFTTLSNGMTFRTEDIDKLFKKAAVKQGQLEAPRSRW